MSRWRAYKWYKVRMNPCSNPAFAFLTCAANGSHSGTARSMADPSCRHRRGGFPYIWINRSALLDPFWRGHQTHLSKRAGGGAMCGSRLA